MVLLCSQEGIFYSKVHITVLVKCRIASYETISKIEEGAETILKDFKCLSNKVINSKKILGPEIKTDHIYRERHILCRILEFIIRLKGVTPDFDLSLSYQIS